MTYLHEISIEERWSPVQVLLWIATRSRRFMDALEGVPLIHLEARLGRVQRENHSPYPLTLSDALREFRQEVERGSIGGRGTFRRERDGTLPKFNMPEFSLMEISFPSTDVLRTWPDWPATLAWKAAKARPWQAPVAVSRAWMRSLPPGEYVPLADVVDLLAFGPTKMAIGLSQIDEHTARLRAGIAIINAAIEGKVALAGTPCERLLTHPHLLRQTGHRIVIESEALDDAAPVLFGGRDWLGPRRYAEEHAESGHAPQSVSFCDVRIERGSLLKWLSALATRAPGLSEAEVRDLIRGEKTKDSSIGIGKIVQMVKSKDPLFPRDSVRKIARAMGIMGRRGKKSREIIPPRILRRI
jgi:hypothetical protein